MKSDTRDRKPLDNIQVGRFLAAFFVVFSHVIHEAADGGIIKNGEGSYKRIFDGSVGVDIFFVISGLIMVFSSTTLFGKGGASGYFLKRRLIRVVPLYWIFTLLMIAALFLFPGKMAHSLSGIGHVIASLLFAPARDSVGAIQPVLTLGWTLNYEMMFYAIFACCLALPMRAAVVAACGAISFLALIGILIPNSAPAPLLFWTRPIILEFGFGMVLGLLLVAHARIQAWHGIVLLGVSIALFVATSRLALVDTSWRWLAAGVPAAMFVAAAGFSPQLPDRGYVRLLRFGGDASYALYLSHPFTINMVVLLWRFAPTAHPGMFIVAALMSAVVVSAIVHVLVERPILDLLHGRPVALLDHPWSSALRGRLCGGRRAI